MEKFNEKEDEDEKESERKRRKETSDEGTDEKIYNISDSGVESYDITPKAMFKKGETNSYTLQKKKKKVW